MDAEEYRRPAENSSPVIDPKQAPTSAAPPYRPEPAAPTKAVPKGAQPSKSTAPASTAPSSRWIPASASSASTEATGLARWAGFAWGRRPLNLL